MMYFGVPLVLPIRFTAFQAGVLVFAMNSAAYISESLKGGINAIDRGQYEAAMALGVHYPSMMKDIILPQAIKNILPALCNQFIMMVKETSLASVFFIGVTLLFLDFTGTIHAWLGWMAKVQFLPAVLALNFGVVAVLRALTLIFGRV